MRTFERASVVLAVVALIACDSEESTGGTVQPGGDCSSNYDCAPSNEGESACVFETVGGKERSYCQIQVQGAEGNGPCSLSDDPEERQLRYVTCADTDDLYCDGAPGTCKRVHEIGTECRVFSAECGYSAYCDDSGAKNVCAPRRAVGADCMSSDECQLDAQCDSTTMKCTSAD